MAALLSQLPRPDDAAHDHAAIETVVTQVFGVDVRELHRATRGRAPVALARQVAMYLAHAGCGVNMSNAGEMFARDRTTVAHACVVVEDRRDDPVFDRLIELLECAVKAMSARASGLPQAER